MQDNLNLLIEAICRVKDIETGKVSATTSIEDLLMDSLDEVEVMMFLEDELGIEIDQTQIETCVTVGDFVAVIDRMVEQLKQG
jgi:acyl carrier protein